MDVLRAAKRLVTGGAMLAAGLVASAGLAGCSDTDPIVTQTPSPSIDASASEGPGVSPSGVPSPAASPTASPVALSDEELLALLPAGAERDDLQGAVVTAEFFIQEFPKMFATGDTRVWDSLSLDGCDFCESSRANALRYKNEGWIVTGGEISDVPEITEANLQSDGSVAVLYPAMEAEIFATEPGMDVRSVSSVSRVNYYLLMEFHDAVWRVTDVDTEDA
ncbi:DUF6318 family protein [Demequina aurantiaca]|uniref:DUF6318 family protein n=1 Tax=Demequina aurantiaca TaxID=676200 RepID=UPI003D3342A0